MRRGGTSPTRTHCSLAIAEDGFARLGAALAAAAGGGGTFADRLHATAHAYVGFATTHPALLDLMFAAKHGPTATPALVEAGRTTFEPLLELLVDGQRSGEVAGGDPEQVGTTLFAAVHGIAALVSAGMLDATAVDATVDDASVACWSGCKPGEPPRTDVRRGPGRSTAWSCSTSPARWPARTPR